MSCINYPSIEEQVAKMARILFDGDKSQSIDKLIQGSGLSKDLVYKWSEMPTKQRRLTTKNSMIKENGQYEMQPAYVPANTVTTHSDLLSGRRESGMNDTLELRRLTAAVVRRWWLVLLLTMLATLVGYTISQRIRPVYEATTSVIVGQSIQATNLDTRDIQTSERLALSYADIARRQPVLEAVNISLNLGYPWQNLRKRVRVRLVPNTQLLEISVEADSREEAVLIADEVAQQLILLSPASLKNQENETTKVFVQQRLRELQGKIETTQENVDELRDKLVRASTAAQRSETQAEIDKLEGMILEWENNYSRFLTLVSNEESANYLAVVEKAYAKQSPVRPHTRLNTIIAGAIGFMLALGIIAVLEFLDDTLKTMDDIGRSLQLTPLGTINLFGTRENREQRIVLQNPFSPASESYRMIRNNIQFMSIDKPGKSLLVTSPAPGDGKSSVAVNLGIAMANNGYKTTLVDTDLRKPVLHEVFQVPREVGLTDFLLDFDKDADLPLHTTQVERLQLVTAGKQPPNPSELLGSQRMVDFMERLMRETDIVIYDSPPVAFVGDAAVLSTRVDGVVFIVSAGKTRRDLARRALFNLKQVGSNILGVVLNRALNNGGRYGYYSPTDQIEQEGNRAFVLLQNVWKNVTFFLDSGVFGPKA